jgi:membrane protease YdiL (CAAX protease family)
MSSPIAQLLAAVEIGLAIIGLVLLWRLFLRPAARAERPPPLLARWEISLPDFIAFLLVVIGGSIFGGLVGTVGATTLELAGDAKTVFAGAAAQLGMMGAVLMYWAKPERGPPTSAPGGANILKEGAITFVVSFPLLLIAAKLWELVLRQLNLSTERQSLIAMFANADSPLLLTVMIALAIVIAPFTEELVFRAGLFRFLRTRLPHWLALVLSAFLFASLHVNWKNLEGLTSLVPLMVLAIMFSLAYERTGKIGTPIVAHALFNLNTIALIFSGLGL